MALVTDRPGVKHLRRLNPAAVKARRMREPYRRTRTRCRNPRSHYDLRKTRDGVLTDSNGELKYMSICRFDGSLSRSRCVGQVNGIHEWSRSKAQSANPMHTDRLLRMVVAGCRHVRWTAFFACLTVLPNCADAAGAVEAQDGFCIPHGSLSPMPAEAVRALYQRPTNADELLRNLKVAMDGRLLLQPAFFESASLLKFFNGARVHRTGSPSQAQDTLIGNYEVSIQFGGLPKMAVSLQRRCEVVNENSGSAGTVQSRGTTAAGNISVAGLPGLNVSAVRRVFGKETREERPSPGTDSVQNRTDALGWLVYDIGGAPSSVRASLRINQIVFRIIPGPTARTTNQNNTDPLSKEIFRGDDKVENVGVSSGER